MPKDTVFLPVSFKRPSKTYKCKLCHVECPGFYALRQHKNTQHGLQMGFGASKVDVEDIVRDVDDQGLGEELGSCKHFLTDTEMENGKHRVFDFAILSFDMSLLNNKLEYVFKELKSAAKVNFAFGLVLKKLRMEFLDTYTLTRTILLWSSQNLCVHKLT